MRKALIAVITASALFAVGAFASEFVVTSEDVASGEGSVGSCAQSVKVVEYTTGTDTPTTGTNTDWSATNAKVELTEADLKDCENAIVDISIGTDSQTDSDTTTDAWTNGSCTFANTVTETILQWDCSFGATPVKTIVEVAILVNGNTVPTS